MNKLKVSALVAALLFGAAVTADAFAQRSGRGGGGGGGGRGHHAHGGHHHGGGHRHHGGHYGWGGLGVGLALTSPFWYGYGWPYYAPYYRPYYGYPAAVGVPAYGYPEYAAGPATYVEQAPPAPVASAPAAAYWYYCNESQAYYPYVNQCAGPWQRVAPQPPPS